MPNSNLKINDVFQEIDILSVDSRNRITVGKYLKNFKRIKVFKDSRGEILLVPIIEIPVSEAWLYQSEDALKSVRKGLQDAKNGRITKKDIKKL